MQLPEDLLVSLKDIAGFDSEAFKAVHASGEQVTSIRVNPAKLKTDGAAIEKLFSCNNAGSILKKDASFTDLAAGTPSTGYNNIPWSACGYYLPRRPSFTFDPLFHAGLYYVQEASSMFLEQALKQLVDLTQPLKILDLSAAPGGKSTH